MLVRLMVVAMGVGCGMDCEEYDPGQGCDLVLICCNDASECEYRTRSEEVFECAGGALNCRRATQAMLCAVCGEGIRDGLGCGTVPEQYHPL